jgi:MarR-like DNA-binding transcriptional regulator SgrR of sgrS sRNA
MKGLVAFLMERRYQIPNVTLVDCLDLAQAFTDLPAQATIDELCTHWSCTQSNVSRRLGSLRKHGLIDWSMTGRGRLVIRRIGPSDGVSMTDLGELADWIFQNRHRYAKTQLLDLLDLGRMWAEGLIGPDQVVQLQQLMTRWSASRRPVQTRLHRLRDAGLIAYRPGNNHHPGYRITRIGPPPPPPPMAM